MSPRRRIVILAAGLAIALMGGVGAPRQAAMAYPTVDEGEDLEFGVYKVTNPDESYFDVATRMKVLAGTDDPQLVQLKEKVAMGLSCRALKAKPILDGEVTQPSFYDSPKEWKFASEPFLAFEQQMSQLAGAWVATGDPYFANCLVEILDRWAEADALNNISYSTRRPQVWYSVESMIFSAALAYSTVTGKIEIPAERRRRIDQWLKRIAKHHFSFKGSVPSCCNNHYYRRSLYMTIVGVIANDDEMFQTGLKSVVSALSDTDERGAFGFALRRGWRAIHYQNYSLLYVVMTMQVAYRQGYDLFKIRVNGQTIREAVLFLLRSLEYTYAVPGLPSGEQDLAFTNDPQYFAWMEIWLRHFDNPRIERFVRLHRPVFNRSAGGYLTLYFKKPESPRQQLRHQIANFEIRRKTAVEIGARYPVLEMWKYSQ